MKDEKNLGQTTLGFHAHRLVPNTLNPREVTFLRCWQKQHELSDLLTELLSCSADNYSNKATLRDRTIAATIIQWLGSPVGISFLHDTLKQVGFTLKEK